MRVEHAIRNGGCTQCQHPIGYVETKAGQDCLYCANCGKFQYNVPRTESGRAVRSLRTRPNISPSQRTRILDRDGGACILCHATDRPLDIGHLVSVDDGKRVGWDGAKLYHDDNLAAMCAPCNSGYSALSVNPHVIAAAIHARATRRARGGGA